MTEEEWGKFVDNGIVSTKMLSEIAFKICMHNALDDREISVYRENSNIIEKLIDAATNRNK